MYAARPLRLEELRHTVAISWLGRPYFDHRKKLNQRPKVLDQCTFLITIDGTSDQGDIFAIDDDDDGAAAQSHNGQSTWHKDAVLRLAHASVLQFLQDTEKLSDHAKGFCLDPSAGNLTLAQSCIAYAIYLDGLTSLIPDPEVTPLFSYTIKYWYYHATEAGPGSTESMATLMKEALNTKWDIYRLLTYPNPSTRYNPWPERQSATQDRMSSDSPQSSLCRTCQTICRRELSGASGIEHQTYEMVILSSNQCKLCNMIHQALLHFGVARKCSASGKTSLSDKEAERLLLEMDEEISRNASAAKIWLKGEADDPFLLISCHCYLGRLHLYTTLGKSNYIYLPHTMRL